MPVFHGEFVPAGGQPVDGGGKLQLDDPPPGAQIGGRGKISSAELQCQFVLVQPDDNVLAEHPRIKRGFVSRNEAVAIPVDEGEHVFGDVHTGSEVDLHFNPGRFDGHKGRLQIFVEPVGPTGEWQNEHEH